MNVMLRSYDLAMSYEKWMLSDLGMFQITIVLRLIQPQLISFPTFFIAQDIISVSPKFSPDTYVVD